MKNIILVIVSLCLVLSICLNFAFFQVLRYEYDLGGYFPRSSTFVIWVLSKNDKLTSLNESLEKEVEINSDLYKKVKELNRRTLDSLSRFENDLISISGGLNPETGELMHSKGKEYVNDYFFKANMWNSYAAMDLDLILQDYNTNILSQSGIKESNIETIYSILESTNKKNVSEIIKDMTVNEVIYLLNNIKQQVRLDEYEFLVKEMKKTPIN